MLFPTNYARAKNGSLTTDHYAQSKLHLYLDYMLFSLRHVFVSL